VVIVPTVLRRRPAAAAAPQSDKSSPGSGAPGGSYSPAAALGCVVPGGAALGR
jgi:hypothetical protein